MRSENASAKTGGIDANFDTATISMIPAHFYEVRPRKDHRGVDLISDALPFSVRHYFFNSISSAWLGVLPVISTVCVSASRQTT